MIKHLNTYLIILTAILFSCSFTASAEEFVIIVNKLNPINTITKATVKKYFFKDLVLWDDGVKVVPVDYVDTHPLAKIFSLNVLNMDLGKKNHILISNTFSGKSTPPMQLATEDEVISAVAAEHGAIGYVSASRNTDKVRVITLQ